jgi:N-acetylglucosaminyl-diphospho-decaprenol L-rhamnosyltransferase
MSISNRLNREIVLAKTIAPSNKLDLSIIVVNWNTKDLLLQTVQSVIQNPPQPYSFEIIVVDNASSDGSTEALMVQFPQVRLIANTENKGFGPANNQALAVATGRYSLLLNSDVIVLPESLHQVLEFMEAHPDCGMCGVQVLNADGTFQGSYADYLNLWSEFLILSTLGRKLLNPQYPSHSEKNSQQTKAVDTIQGAFMFCRTEALNQIGRLDEQFFMYGEENDLSLRLQKKGWKTYYLAEIKLIHLGGQSTRQNWTKMAWQLQKSKVLMFRKHYGRFRSIGFKVLVSVAVLVKVGAAKTKAILSKTQKENWFNRQDFHQFWRV